MERLRSISFVGTPSFMMLAYLDHYPNLESFSVIGCPGVGLTSNTPHQKLRNLTIRGTNDKQIPRLAETAPNIATLNLSENQYTEIEHLDELACLKKVDLRDNNLFPLRSLGKYFENLRKAKALRAKGIEVLL
jgi:Leucine-rich repeat (LRR) protein